MPHSGGSGAWGSGPWGGGAWGGGSGGVLTLLSALAVRENAFRLEFSSPVYFSTILDPDDAADPDKYSVAAVAGSSGLDGNPAREVAVIEVFLPGEPDGVAAGDVGRFVDLVTDRPMTPWQALYDVSFTDVHSSDLLAVLSGTARVPAVFKRLEPPRVDQPLPTRDFANPQTLSGAQAGLPDPADEALLGTIRVDDSGDYAFDEGLVSFRKRVIRRGVTRRGGFAHLPGYGVGILDQGKRLAISTVLSDLAAQYEAQVALEPETAQVRVRPVVDPNVPGLARFRVAVRPKQGAPQLFDVPFITGS